jgi:hypothetical protein
MPLVVDVSLSIHPSISLTHWMDGWTEPMSPEGAHTGPTVGAYATAAIGSIAVAGAGTSSQRQRGLGLKICDRRADALVV